MAVRVNPRLIEEIKELGAFDISACFNCGTCTGICPISREGKEFPRRLIRYAILGVEEKVRGIEPWLCLLCGRCSETCPRGANPTEFIRTLRKYLITNYILRKKRK